MLELWVDFLQQGGFIMLGLFFLFFSVQRVSAQGGFCQFDAHLQQYKNQNSQYQDLMNHHEQTIQEMLNGNTQAIMNGMVYMIPVVFHVIHLGEPVGIGSNISDTQIQQALADLNADFRNTSGQGNDTEIEFCLAQRAPDGNASTGINRVNGFGTENYQNIGIGIGINEIQVKALSLWPNRDYVNIWVVHSIAGGSLLGYSTFPGMSSAIDGIVLRSDIVGTGSNSKVISHEMGHFMDLLHTFEGGDVSNCPPNTSCTSQGDFVCDTRPHKQPAGGCDVTGLNDCDANSSLALVAHNHMNYTDNACREEFTPGQIERMRAALMTIRRTLTYSLGCSPACPTVTANFNAITNSVELNSTLNFDNTSTGASTYKWLVDGAEFATTEDYAYSATETGVKEICLLSFNGTCVNRKCLEVITFKDCLENPPCEEVLNGNFEQIAGDKMIGVTTGSTTDYKDLCGWDPGNSTPFYCNKSDNNCIGLWINNNVLPEGEAENAVTRFPIFPPLNRECIISFDYLVCNKPVGKLILGMTVANNTNNLVGAEIIAEVNNPLVSYINAGIGNEKCYPSGAVFQHYTGPYTFTSNFKPFLRVGGTPIGMFDANNPTIVYIDNISINCCNNTPCTPAPDMSFIKDNCNVTFYGFNTGDPATFSWNFGDGPPLGSGEIVNHTYLYGGEFDACLTLTCLNAEKSVTTCRKVTIPETCDQCTQLPPVPITTCSASQLGSNTYMANFCFTVPKGYKGCGDKDKMFVQANNPLVNMLIKSYTVGPGTVTTDQICVALQVIAPANTNFTTLKGYITLCGPEGERICRKFEVIEQTCDQCLPEITTTAICNDPVLNDNLRIYQGSIVVTVIDGIYNNALSTEAGFSVNPSQITKVGDTFTIPYIFTTTNTSLASFSGLLTFTGAGNSKICVPVTITLPPCNLPPCGLEWTPKRMNCSGTDGQFVYFDIEKSVNVGNLQICNQGLIGIIDDGEVEVLESKLFGGVLDFKVKVKIPCSKFSSGNIYNMRIVMCTEEGSLACLLFPMEMYCTNCQGGLDGGGEDRAKLPVEKPIQAYQVMPNPTSDRVNVAIKDYTPEKRYDLRLVNAMGQVVKTERLISDRTEIDLITRPPGVYQVSITANGVLVYVDKLVLLR